MISSKLMSEPKISGIRISAVYGGLNASDEAPEETPCFHTFLFDWHGDRWGGAGRNTARIFDQPARRFRTVAKHYVFPMFCGSGGLKSRPAKAAGAFGSSLGDEQVHAAVAPSRCRSQNVKSTTRSEHFWKFLVT